ncbi:hypothetical protein BDZ45DRAFT_667204 [Acephala macrosclerotiorum]|nr:hypothetical protein BDZ45DRAFT_667204 [Acephala macrosclerotiorum]
MTPHSLHRPQRVHEPSDARQLYTKKAGAPKLQWTPSQERTLFRLVAKANVPWKYIALAMEEPEMPAEPGKPGCPAFAPGISTCRTHWYEMTEIKPHKILSSPLARKKQREQMEIAFEAYQKRQLRLLDENQQLPTPPELPKLSWEEHASVIPAPTIAADISTPQLTFEGTTPADLGPPVLTPESHDTIQPVVSGDEAPQPSAGIQASPEAGSNKLPPVVPSSGTKRRAPSEFDVVTHGNHQKLLKQQSTASVEQDASRDCALPLSTTNIPSHARVSTLGPVQEEPDGSEEPKTVAELEDKMHVERGFIAFVKYGLTRSRFSVQSVISATSTIASRISSRRSSHRLSVEPKAPKDSNPFFYGQYLSDLGQSQSYSPQAPSQHLKPGRQETDLFLELRLAGSTDEEVATRIETLLQECGSKEKAEDIVRARNPRRETALEVALALGNVPTCEVLLKFGADVKAKTSDGKSLSAFGRAAERNATTSQQYFAIGACRNRIRSHTEGKAAKEKPKEKSEAPKAKKKSNIGARLGRVASSQTDAPGPKSSLPAPVAPPPSDDQGQDAPLSASHDKIHHRQVVGQEFDISYNQPISPQQIRAPHVPNLVEFWNGVSDQQVTQTPRATSTSQIHRPITQLWNSYFPAEGAMGIPALPAYDSRAGHWELLPGGRMAFVLDSFDAAASFSEVRMVPSRPPPPIPATESNMSLGMNLPMAQNDFSQSRRMSSTDTRRHGINPSTFSNGLTMPPNNNQFQGSRQRGTIAGTMSSQLQTTPAGSNAYGFQDYNSQANTLTNSWVNEMEFQQNFPAMDTTLPDTFESDVEDVLFDGLQNHNYVQGWDFQRPGF